MSLSSLQRDYAQGRPDPDASRIRHDFLGVLHRALTGGEAVGLDFVYGDVTGEVLTPLDGQQRLTTLFLLHWYLAARADRLDEQQGWKQFSYDTRHSARRFCEELVKCRPPFAGEGVSEWLRDQPWYLGTWRHDPTILAMLVMIDAIADLFDGADCTAAWARLVDAERPAIRFHLLPLEEMGLSEDLYIKMNSRGKPLTEFEHFKALFEQHIREVYPDRSAEFAHKVDIDWSDIFWPYRGDDNVIDDEFLRYLRFVTEIRSWLEGRHATTKGIWDDKTYAASNPNARANLDFLFAALDCWRKLDIGSFFSGCFTLEGHEAGKVAIYSNDGDADVDLFRTCCNNYGRMAGDNRRFPLQRTLLLYATVVHRIENTADFPDRLRLVRNMIEGSEYEVRLSAMPRLLASVHDLIASGDLSDVPGFNQRQLDEERTKRAFLAANTAVAETVRELEDHSLLRGSLGAFDLDPAMLARRAPRFLAAFEPRYYSELTGALLACGDYFQPFTNGRMFQFGSGNAAQWRDLFKGPGRAELVQTRTALGALLDQLDSGPVAEKLAAIQADFLSARAGASRYDWRYYFVKYPSMRTGRSGIYVGMHGRLGYSVCMLNKRQMNSWYRDPYLLAVWKTSGVDAKATDPWFTGSEHEERWMELERSRTKLRCVESGFLVAPPPARKTSHTERHARFCAARGIGPDGLVAVPQSKRGDEMVDNVDRIELGAALVAALVKDGA